MNLSLKNETNDWKLTFDPGDSALVCRHSKTGVELGGTLNFTLVADGKATAWGVVPACDGEPQRLSLVDPKGDVQGYIAVVAEPNRLELRLVHRLVVYHGVLSFVGTARIGAATFACRVSPKPGSPIVQMASGPADSGLNDALFDSDDDTLLHLDAATVQITQTVPSTRFPTFNLRMTAHHDNTANSALIFKVYEYYYRSRYVPHYRPINRKRCPAPPTGWMSWNVYFDKAGETENLEEARVGAQYLQPFGMEIWSIESWQANSDQQPVSEFHNLTLEQHPRKFPHGMKWLARQIKALGFKPGIWTNPFGTGSHDFYQSHKDWFLHDKQGKPFTNWAGLYLLDPSQPRIRKHMRDTHRIMSRIWGYKFFKIDAMSAFDSGYSAHFYERPEVRAAFKGSCDRPYALCVKALREGMGPDRLFTACAGHSTGPETALADAARIGGDIVHHNQPPTWKGLISQANASLRQLFVHNLVWYNDPDTLLVGAHTTEAAQVATAIVALPGQVTFSGDKLGELSPDRMRLIQQALPVCDVRPMDLFPIFELKSVWDLKIARPFGAWDVVSLFNWTDAEAQGGFTFADLGLPGGDHKYLLFDFWAQKFLGEFTEGFQRSLPPRSCLLLAVHPATGRPQFLSTDRHVTQGGTCLRKLRWDNASCTLMGETDLVQDHAQMLFIRVPDGYALQQATAGGAVTVQAKMGADGVLSLTLKRQTKGAAAWQLRFTRT